MNTPPVIPQSAPKAPSSSVTNDKLLKRASHAGRNLSVLAILTTCGTIALIAISFFAKGVPVFVPVLATTLVLIAAAYWVLAVAARRGNPNAVGIVIVAMVVQFALVMISSGVAAARNNASYQPNLPGLAVPILVFVALYNSRKVLLELKDKQLWDRVFGSAKPSGNLCIVGGILLAVGFAGMDTGSLYLGWKAAEEQKVEYQHAEAFVQLLKGDEQEFMIAMRGLSGAYGKGEIDTALTRLNSLETNLEVIEKDAAGAERLLSILTTYGNAVRQWKNALMLLKEPDADTNRAQKMLKLGDQLRAEACEEFDRRYAAKKAR